PGRRARAIRYSQGPLLARSPPEGRTPRRAPTDRQGHAHSAAGSLRRPHGLYRDDGRAGRAPGASRSRDAGANRRQRAGAAPPQLAYHESEMSVSLSERQREILRRIVEEYVASGQPVGSKTLVERAGFVVSPSTVRAELADLERHGLLTHP